MAKDQNKDTSPDNENKPETAKPSAKEARGAEKPDFMAKDYSGPVTTSMVARKQEFEKKETQQKEKSEQKNSEE